MSVDFDPHLLRDQPARIHELPDEEVRALISGADRADIVTAGAAVRDAGHGRLVTYSRKVFVPLTKLCRDVCHYCAFAQPPRRGQAAYMTPDDVLAVARAGEAAGCKELLFTLGDKPELRYRAAREALAALGHETTLGYLAEMCALVLSETSLLPHVNPGVMTGDDIAMLRKVSVSSGLMLESAAARLTERGGPHFGSPDKDPERRLETIRRAGELRVPFTTGMLIGIGESESERIDTLLAIRAMHRRFGHVQEVIIQPFRAKPGTRMASSPEPTRDELMWAIAAARLVFGPEANIQAPPNLSPEEFPLLLAAGLNDWGGVSPVTPDHVNPEAPWPHLVALEAQTEQAGHRLAERLAIYPRYCLDADRWLAPALATRLLSAIDGSGLARTQDWSPGSEVEPPREAFPAAPIVGRIDRAVMMVVRKASEGAALSIGEIEQLFQARGTDYHAVCAAADELRTAVNGETVTYVVNRNINYTNVCHYRCQFCAFSKGKLSENLRGTPYDLTIDEIVRRAEEAWERGATEVCMQGGIHPDYTGETYVEICRAVSDKVPDLHIHAFSPLEISQGAETLGLTVSDFLVRLRNAGLDTLPGTAAEILDDAVRATLCPDKIDSKTWLTVMAAAHELGLPTTSTIMFGHIDGPRSWAKHLIRLRDLQIETGGFTEFVPLPFVHMEAPIYLKGRARRGPTFREAVLMHAVARLALHPHIRNIQASWVKMGRVGVKACLRAGANDLGGTLMNESISRAAGTVHGQEMPPEAMDGLIADVGREPKQRTTLYGPVTSDRRRASYGALPLTPVVQSPVRKRRVRSGMVAPDQSPAQPSP